MAKRAQCAAKPEPKKKATPKRTMPKKTATKNKHNNDDDASEDSEKKRRRLAYEAKRAFKSPPPPGQQRISFPVPKDNSNQPEPASNDLKQDRDKGCGVCGFDLMMLFHRWASILCFYGAIMLKSYGFPDRILS